ncbi:MAG: pilus assembly protein TadG [Sphingomonadales bacterium]|nr:pilus assembly protein TadG [Sphingomonadales bacterium]MDE2567976.1 pilus assembly protein TadG [Sphingomonadales bacterium]
MPHRQTWQSLIRDVAGSVLPIVAGSVLVIVGLIGGGFDASRMYRTHNALQAACDAGVLAGRRAVTTNGFDASAQAQAASYFNTNFDEAREGSHNTSFVPTTKDNGNSVDGSASTDLPMMMMQVLGFRKVNIKATCSATMGVGNSDVTMVLDTTGSMDSTLPGSSTTRIQALRAAMKNFYSTVATATAGSNARVRYAFVPYSTTVNVGHLLYDADPSWLVDTYAIQSRKPVYNTVTQQVRVGWDNPVDSTSQSYSQETTSAFSYYSNTVYRNGSTCAAARPADGAWQDNGSPTTSSSTTTNGAGQQVATTVTQQPQVKQTYSCYKYRGSYYVITYQTFRTFNTYAYATSDPVYQTQQVQQFDHFDYMQRSDLDYATYKTFQPATSDTGNNGAALTSTWDGCIGERQTVASGSVSWSSLTGMSPSGLNDLDIDTAPDSDDATKWAPLWPDVAYYRTTGSGGGGSSLSSALVTQSGRKAGYSCPNRSQLLQSMNQTDFNAYADALTASGNTYHDIGMLWGARLSSPQGIFASNVTAAPANGGKVSRHIIFMTDGEPNANYTMLQAYGIEWHDRRITDDGSTDDDARHEMRFRAICDAIKAKGIRIWVIGFTSGLTSDLSYCASPNSAYTANDAAQLDTAFQEIAKQVGELRVQL